MSLAHLAPHAPATFPFDRKPLQPELWPHWQDPVNRERVYDFYAKEAEYFRSQASVPMSLPQFPGLDGGSHNRLMQSGYLLFAAHSGINPCFFCGRQSRLVESASSASAR